MKNQLDKILYRKQTKKTLPIGVEERLAKIKQLFDIVKKSKANKKKELEKKDWIRESSKQKINVGPRNGGNTEIKVEKEDASVKTEALAKLYDIAGEEWVANNM